MAHALAPAPAEGLDAGGPLVARSETRFAAPWGATIEFQLDGQGTVTGAVVEQGPYRITLERKWGNV